MQELRSVAGGGGDFGAFVVRPDGPGPFPAVIFFHHGPGLDDGSTQAMQLLADRGYYVVAPDRYHRLGPWLKFDVHALMEQGQESPAFQEFVDTVLSTTEDDVQRDLVAVLDHVADDPAARPAPMGCIGYCIGARSVLMAMTAHPGVFAAGVALHPSFCVTDGVGSPHHTVPGISGSLYVGVSAADEISSAKDNEPLISAVGRRGGRGVAEVHPGAGHGFAVPGASWHDDAAHRSYQAAFRLFEPLGSGTR